MSWLAWTGILLVMVFIVYFLFFYGRPKKSRPVTRVQPPPYKGYDRRENVAKPVTGRFNEEDEPEPVSDYVKRRRRERATIEGDHADDYLMASALASTLNSEDHHVSHRPHDSDLPTPDPEPTSIGGPSHFETGGGFGGEGFSSGSSDVGSGDAGTSDGGGGSND